MQCCVCGDYKRKQVYLKNGYNVWRCLTCGYTYVYPLPSDLKRYYNDKSYYYYNEVAESWVQRAKVDIMLIQQYKPTGTLLDVGCGLGHFLLAAHDAGYDATGIDMSDYGVAQVCKLGLTAYNCKLEDMTLEPKYDIITLRDVFEHIPDPANTLAICNALLKPGGVLYIVVPNINSMRAKLDGRNWYQLVPPYHVNYFNTATLTKLVSTKFNVLRTVSMPSYTFGVRKWLVKFNAPLTNSLIRGITTFKRVLMYPPINYIASKLQLESNILICIAKKGVDNV